MSVIQDEVSIRSALYKFGIQTINIKDLIYRLESTQQDRVSNTQNTMMGNFNQHQIYWWAGYIICFILGHQLYTDWEIKYVCCARILLNFS